MINDFNFENEEDMERLFSYLEKDKFNSLSFDDQNKVIDTLISISNKDINGSNVKTLGFMKGSNGMRNIDIQNIIDQMGYEPFREVMREAISGGGIQLTSMHRNELQKLYEKAKQGNLSKEELEQMQMIMGTFHHNEPENIQFSTYTVLHLYCGLLEKSSKDNDVLLLNDAEPFINAAYIALLSAFISHDDNPIGKMFSKHGFEKTKLAIDDLTVKFSNLIIEYSKEHDLAPERTMIALLNVIKILADPLNTTMDYPDDKVGEVLEHLLVAMSGLEEPETVDKIRQCSKDKTNDSDNNSANADIKDSKSDIDIRKLLLDD